MKKLLIVALCLAVAVAIGVNTFSRKAPEMLRAAISRALDKNVSIRDIEFKFPWNFELSGVTIRDSHGPFQGEICFSVDRVYLSVSPLSLSRRDLVIDRIEARDASIVIRNRDGELYHVLSDAMAAQPAAQGGSAHAAAVTDNSQASVPLSIHRFKLSNGNFRFVDYDVQESGFVIALEGIEAVVKDIALPFKEDKTSYRLQARMLQGRDQKAATVQASGWTMFASYDTDAIFSADDLYLPYFEPYLAQVTPARVQEGVLTNRSSLRIKDKEFIADLDFELSGLYFSTYEEGDQLFGLKAQEILSFLKDAAGRLHFQIVLQWNIADKNVKKSDIIRRAIERSLKKTVLGNLGNILENTLKRLGEGGEGGGDGLEGTLKKVKELFR